jgi:hypothetical protein
MASTSQDGDSPACLMHASVAAVQTPEPASPPRLFQVLALESLPVYPLAVRTFNFPLVPARRFAGRVPAQGRRTEARGGNRRSDLDPRGHRAEGDRSGQAGGSGTVAAHAPNRSGGSAGGKARNRHMDTRLSDLGHNGEGAWSASSHRHAERSPRSHVALRAARARARRRRGRVPAGPKQREA